MLNHYLSLPWSELFLSFALRVVKHTIFTTKKNIMQLLKKNHVVASFTLALLFMVAIPLKANPGGFSDEELESFAGAVTQVITIQQEGQTQMMEKIEEHDLTVQRFNEINMQVQQMPLEEVEATEEELASFMKANEEIETIQMGLEQLLIGAIEDEGISIEKYEEIMGEYQQNPELQQRIQELMQ